MRISGQQSGGRGPVAHHQEAGGLVVGEEHTVDGEAGAVANHDAGLLDARAKLHDVQHHLRPTDGRHAVRSHNARRTPRQRGNGRLRTAKFRWDLIPNMPPLLSPVRPASPLLLPSLAWPPVGTHTPGGWHTLQNCTPE